jgi:hypothetical protein
MIFVIDNLKYDTDKMELISDKCKYQVSIKNNLLYVTSSFRENVLDVKLWKSAKGRWLITYKRQGYVKYSAQSLTETEVKDLLITYDLPKYEELFGELEEA